MSYDDEIASILRGVRTRRDQVKLLMQLDELAAVVFKTGSDTWEKALGSTVSEDVAVIISNMIKQGEEPQKILRKIIDAVKNLPVVKITLAVNPSIEMTDKITHWIGQNLSAEIILEIVVDESIVGGVKISYLGNYGDYSIASRFEEFWKVRQPA